MILANFLQETFGGHLPPDLPLTSPNDGPGIYARHAANLEAMVGLVGRDDLLPLMWTQTWMAPIAGAAAPGFVEQTMYAQFYGPETHREMTNLRVGLFYIGPGLFYPAHVHEAWEIYVRLAGSCEFTLGEDQDQRSYDDFLINEPMAVHAMRAGGAGALFAWIWTGDVNWESYSFV